MLPSTVIDWLRYRSWKWLLLLPLGLIAASTIYPMFFTFNVALKTRRDWIFNRYSLVDDRTWDNFTRAWEAGHMQDYLFNSIITTVGAVIGLWVVCSLAAFSIAVLRFRGRLVLFTLILMGMMIPPEVVIVPLFQVVRDLGFLNTYHGLSLVFIAFNIPFGTYLLTSFYANFPREILEAAKLDGASTMQVFWRIVLPLGRPALATQGILATLSCWNELLLPLIVMQDRDKRTAMVGIATLRGEYGTDPPLLAAAILVAALPVIVIFLVFQSQLTKGLMVGSVKG